MKNRHPPNLSWYSARGVADTLLPLLVGYSQFSFPNLEPLLSLIYYLNYILVPIVPYIDINVKHI